MPPLLQYRSWQGAFHNEWWSIWPIARVALGTLWQRWLFKLVYCDALLLFFMFFFGGYLLAWGEAQAQVSAEQIGRIGADPAALLRTLRRALGILNGSRETFQYFFAYQGGIVIINLALTGSLIVGNDYSFKSLGFYLAKPINRWHYILGKCLAAFLVVQMMTTLPALILYGQHAFDDWNYLLDIDYFVANDGKGPAGITLLLGILAYGTILSAFLSILLVATATWMRRTMPLIMVWMSMFFFMRILANFLVDGLKLDARWRLIDLWSNLTLLGQACLGYSHAEISPQQTQPEFWQAYLVLFGVTIACLIYLNHRTQAVEVVS